MELHLTPAEPPDTQRKAKHMPWREITEKLQATPAEWAQLHHSYASDKAARSALSRASKKYGFKFLVTTRRRQEDGRIGIYITWRGDEQ